MDAENLNLIMDILPDEVELYLISPFADERILLTALRNLELVGVVESEETDNFVIFRRKAA